MIEPKPSPLAVAPTGEGPRSRTRSVRSTSSRLGRGSAIAGSSADSCSWRRRSTTSTGSPSACWRLSSRRSIGWTDTQYGDINAAFSPAYAIGFVVLGRFIDRVGTKAGYAVALVAWSPAAAGHAFARTGCRVRPGAVPARPGEAGNFPAAIKATAEWFLAESGRSRPGSSTQARTSVP